MLSLMIVDDSNIIRRKIERCNDSDAFKVVASAANGLQALELFKQTRPQLVTMDLTMPEMDGIACIQQLVALDPGVRILVISALSDKATGIDALKKGARGFLCKPFTEEQLLEALTELTQD
uniref:response regulator n=1 Tax=Cellvibrio fontiphilus TaxID=1815559 RepID=UPI002B4BB5F0|nr:response regulator [Cellvibrio fontiphilus]